MSKKFVLHNVKNNLFDNIVAEIKEKGKSIVGFASVITVIVFIGFSPTASYAKGGISKEEAANMIRGFENRGRDINMRLFQKPLDQDTVKWTKDLEKRLEEDGKTRKEITIPKKEATAEQKRVAAEIVENSKEVINEAIGVNGVKGKDSDFLIFASFSMGEKNLEKLIASAKRYDGAVLIRGFKEGSLKKTTAALIKLIKKTGGGVAIDPDLFEEYEIRKVPSFVLTNACEGAFSCERKYDIVSGNMSVRYALSKIAESGDLKKQAKERLGR